MSEQDDQISWIKKQIDACAELREQQALGVAYYNQDNTAIMKRKKEYWKSDGSGGGSVVEDPYVSNYKITSGFMQILVDQKVNFSINSGMTAEVGKISVDDILNTGWRDELSESLEEASKKAFSVWQFYMDGSTVKYKEIPSEQITLVMDGDRDVMKVIRQYKTTDDKLQEVDIVELWDSETVTRYQYETGQDWVYCGCDPHLEDVTTFGDVESERIAKGWGKPPFAVLYNNPQMRTDLQAIQTDIDVYDVVKSDWVNNLEDFQAMWWVIKNFGGADLKEFQQDLKQNHAIKVGDDGEVSMETMDIPYEAKLEFIRLAKADIFRDGMGVNMSEIDGAVTATEIRAMFYNLGMKATKTERMINRFLKDVLFFYGHKDTQEFDVSYVRDMIIDEYALVASLNSSVGTMSKESIYKKHPYVDNPAEEIKLMEAEDDPESDLDV